MSHTSHMPGAQPAYLSPMEHGVPWAGLPQPQAPVLWFAVSTNPKPLNAAHRFADGSLYTINYRPGDPGQARADGWVEVPREGRPL